MKKKHCHILLSLTLVFALSGCALVPAAQVTGAALTGYDAAHVARDYIPRTSVEGGERLCAETDKALQRRMRERLMIDGLHNVSAHVIDDQAYLVGQVRDRKVAGQAIEIASGVQGIKTIHSKFYPLSTPHRAQYDTRLQTDLIKALGKSKQLTNTDIRVEVIATHAILIGQTWTFDQKNEAMSIASQTHGINQVVDYIKVKEQPKSVTEG